MEIRQLKTFLKVATLLNFNRAAEALNYSQSTVSVQIQALEEALETRLFDRLPKRIMLTEAGQKLLLYAEKILALAEETRSEVMGGNRPAGSLNIRIPETLATYRLPLLIKRFFTIFPETRLVFSTCAYHSLTQDLSQGLYDLAFLLVDSFQTPNLSVKFIGVEPLTLITVPEHPLAKKNTIHPQDIGGELLLLSKTDCSYRRMFERYLAEEGLDSLAILELNSIHAIKKFVMEGVGISIMPEIAVKREISKGQLAAPKWVENSLEAAVLMIWHEEKWISPALKSFMDMAEELMGNVY